MQKLRRLRTVGSAAAAWRAAVEPADAAGDRSALLISANS